MVKYVGMSFVKGGQGGGGRVKRKAVVTPGCCGNPAPRFGWRSSASGLLRR